MTKRKKSSKKEEGIMPKRPRRHSFDVIDSDGCGCACCHKDIEPYRGAAIGEPSFMAPAVNVCADCMLALGGALSDKAKTFTLPNVKPENFGIVTALFTPEGTPFGFVIPLMQNIDEKEPALDAAKDQITSTITTLIMSYGITLRDIAVEYQQHNKIIGQIRTAKRAAN